MSTEPRIGVVGLGYGANHARVLRTIGCARLVAVCDRDESRLAPVTGEGVAGYRDHEEMLRRERLDAVVVAVPARRHLEVALAAIDAGCALLVEKPFAASLDEGVRLVEAATAAGVALMPGHIERFNPALQETARRVRAGEVGRVLQIAARRLAYFVERGREVDVGVVHDLAYHDVDSLRFVLGLEIERVYAETRGNVRTPHDDAISALLRFRGEDEGPIGTLEVNWLSTRKVRDLTVLGDRGMLVADYADFRSPRLEFQAAQALAAQAEHEGSLSLRGAEPGPPQALPLTVHEPLAAELEAFVSALSRGAPMPVAVEDALAALAAVDALSESARLAQAVQPRPIRAI